MLKDNQFLSVRIRLLGHNTKGPVIITFQLKEFVRCPLPDTVHGERVLFMAQWEFTDQISHPYNRAYTIFDIIMSLQDRVAREIWQAYNGNPKDKTVDKNLECPRCHHERHRPYGCWMADGSEEGCNCPAGGW